MDRPEIESWFAAQSERFRILVLIKVMHWLTLSLREVATTDDLEPKAKWEAAWIVSECNHRLTGYVSAVMTGRPHYPEDVIIGILFDHLDHPAVARFTHYVWDKAVEDATRLGAHLHHNE